MGLGFGISSLKHIWQVARRHSGWSRPLDTCVLSGINDYAPRQVCRLMDAIGAILHYYTVKQVLQHTY